MQILELRGSCAVVKALECVEGCMPEIIAHIEKNFPKTLDTSLPQSGNIVLVLHSAELYCAQHGTVLVRVKLGDSIFQINVSGCYQELKINWDNIRKV